MRGSTTIRARRGAVRVVRARRSVARGGVRAGDAPILSSRVLSGSPGFSSIGEKRLIATTFR
jgi:hypothetical protein